MLRRTGCARGRSATGREALVLNASSLWSSTSPPTGPLPARPGRAPGSVVLLVLENALPDVVSDRNDRANKLVPRFLTETFGERDKAWETRKQPKKDGSGKMVLWVFVK